MASGSSKGGWRRRKTATGKTKAKERRKKRRKRKKRDVEDPYNPRLPF